MIEILILENTIVVEQYKELIDGEKNKDWNVGIARNIKEAVAYAKKVDLHVLIFDQRLDDEELGTEAFKKIIEGEKPLRNRIYASSEVCGPYFSSLLFINIA